MVQSGFKTLILLLGANRSGAIKYLENTDNFNSFNGRGKEQNEREKNAILNKGQMSVLISILWSALTDAEHHNATFGVIKQSQLSNSYLLNTMILWKPSWRWWFKARNQRWDRYVFNVHTVRGSYFILQFCFSYLASGKDLYTVFDWGSNEYTAAREAPEATFP